MPVTKGQNNTNIAAYNSQSDAVSHCIVYTKMLLRTVLNINP